MSRENNFKSIISEMYNLKCDENTNNELVVNEKKEFNIPKDNWLSCNFSKNKYSSYKPFQFVDGEGVRCSIYLSGCLFSCKECFNESIQNFEVGKEYSDELEEKIISDLSKSYVQGLTILGGEPFLNTEVAIRLASRVRESFGDKKDIWVYSGYTYEQILLGSEDKKKLLRLCDVLVDGPFMLSLKDMTLKFRGSRNQRIINLKESTINNIVLYLD